MREPRTFGEVIASPSNPGIKTIRSLQRRKIRLQERAYVVEGLRAVDDVLAAGARPRAVYIREDLDRALIPDIAPDIPVRVVLSRLFNTLTDVPHPQGILAILPIPDEPEIPQPSSNTAPFVLVIDGVRDPGNLGTLLRSAAAADVDHVMIGPESVDPYHPRAVRAAMGAHVHVPFSHGTWEILAERLMRFDVVALADAGGDVNYDHLSWTGSAALIVGSEAFGPSSFAWEASSVRVAIPLARGIESLNAGVAGSLLMFEAARQRRNVESGQ